MQMSDKMDKHKIQELKEMIQEKDTKEPVDQVLATFCERHGLSLDTCRIYHNRLVERGEIKEK
jgi:predicted transcriptional regulator